MAFSRCDYPRKLQAFAILKVGAKQPLQGTNSTHPTPATLNARSNISYLHSTACHLDSVDAWGSLS